MKNFIEIETKEGRMLINVSQIISVKEFNINQNKSTEIALINSKVEYEVKKIKTPPSEYLVSKSTYNLTVLKPYEEVIELIKKATCQE